MALITRQGKGEKLTIQEMDGNLEYLESLAQESITLTTNGIGGPASLFGNNLNIPFIPAGGVTINGSQAFDNIVFGPSSLVTTSGNVVTLKPEISYAAYRAKIAMQSIDFPGYGYLYNWYAVTDTRKLENPAGGTGLTAPNEWRVPSDTDWDTLMSFAGGNSGSGGKLKSALNSLGFPFYGWINDGGGTDDYNFNAIPGGRRTLSGEFTDIGSTAFWWSTLVVNPVNASARYIIGGLDCCNFIGGYNNAEGFSVRLVREATAGELLLNDGDTSDASSLDPYTGNDGKTYVTVKIGTQIWLAQNLRETKYNDNSDIFNASTLGGDTSDIFWQARGTAQEGAWTAYLSGSAQLQYDPTIIRTFYNDVLEDTISTFISPLWVAESDANGPSYLITKGNGNWNKTHIKITSGYDVSDFPAINERNLLIERAVEGESQIVFRPIKRDSGGSITIEDLNNYNDGDQTSYVYVEILEYLDAYYSSSSLAQGVGVGNL